MKFINVVDAMDKFIDCVPVLSTVKNAGVLIYQHAHKVNRATQFFNCTWRDDIKIQALSKDDFIAKISLVPVLGNIACLIYHVKRAVDEARFGKPSPFNIKAVYPGVFDPLDEASARRTWGTQHHDREIAALYLARNPGMAEEERAEHLRFAARNGNEEVFKVILDSTTTWSSQALRDAFTTAKNGEILDCFSEELLNCIEPYHAAYIFRSLIDGSFSGLTPEERKGWIIYFHDKVPVQKEIDDNLQEELNRILKDAIKKNYDPEIIVLLQSKYPELTHDRQQFLRQAAEGGHKEMFEVLADFWPDTVFAYANFIFNDAAQHNHENILEWFVAHKKNNTLERLDWQAVIDYAKKEEFIDDPVRHVNFIKEHFPVEHKAFMAKHPRD